MSQDEGRFGRISSHRPSWAPRGMRPKAPRQVVRAFVYVFAAICMALGRMTTLILPQANTQMMDIFLKEVSEEFSDYFIIMLVDGAGWHRAGNLKIPENISLVVQPSHSPELNPVEHLWDELREKYLHNQGFASLDQLQHALCNGICRLANAPDRLRSLTDFPYLRLGK